MKSRKGGDFIMQFFHILSSSSEFKVLLIFILLDTFFGSIRAIKEKKLIALTIEI